MVSNLLVIVLLVLVSLSLTSGYSLSTRDAVSKQDDESYVMAASDHGLSMIVVEDLVKARSLQALLAGSKVVVSKAGSKSSSSKSSKKKHKSKKVGPLDVSALVGIIIAAIVVTIVIICVIYFFYLKHQTRKAQSIEQGTATEKINGSSETQTSKTEEHV